MSSGAAGSRAVVEIEEIGCGGLLGVALFEETPPLSDSSIRDRSRYKGGTAVGISYRGPERVGTC